MIKFSADKNLHCHDLTLLGTGFQIKKNWLSLALPGQTKQDVKKDFIKTVFGKGRS